MSIKPFLEITRPLNCLMAAFGTFIGYAVALQALSLSLEIAIAMAVAFLVCAGGIAINDYFDRYIDGKLQPKKPIPSGAVKPRAALAYSSALFIAGNALAFIFLPATAVAIAVAFTLLFLLYSSVMAKRKYVGNFVVAAGTAFTLIFGASLIGNFRIVGFLAVAALFANMARELIKDLEDMEMDRGAKMTLPMLLNEKSVEAMVFIYYLLAILLVYIPVFTLAFHNLFFVAIVSVANALFIYSFGKMVKGKLHAAQQVSKAAMFIALLGFLAGAV